LVILSNDLTGSCENKHSEMRRTIEKNITLKHSDDCIRNLMTIIDSRSYYYKYLINIFKNLINTHILYSMYDDPHKFNGL